MLTTVYYVHIRNGRMRTIGAAQTNYNQARTAAAALDNEDFTDAPQAEASNIETQTLKEQQGDNVEKEQEIAATSKTSEPTAKLASGSDDVRESAGDGGASTTATNSNATPRVRIWLELGGLDGIGAVEVGQATTLTVRAIVPGNMGVRVVDCAALDGLGESKQQLLDDRGCTVDEQVSGRQQAHI